MNATRSITSIRNPSLQRLRRLREATVRAAEGLAVAEGVKVLREALLSEAAIVQVFLAERLLGGEGTLDLSDRLEAGAAAGRWELSVLPDELLGRVAATEHAQGAIAVYRPRAFPVADVLAAGGPVLLLDRLADPGNLGLIVRTAEAAGAGGVVITPGTVDPHNPKAVRAAAGSIFRLPLARAGIEEAAGAALVSGYRLFATSAREGTSHTDADLSGRVGFVLGGEGPGLDAALLERFERLHVPTGRVESLNVAMAAGVLLYEARRQREEARAGGR